jgi:GPH family glycoside/pentoside/hexuronide:cation symporter
LDLAGNGPWLVMFLLGLLTLTGFVIKGQTTAYFFKYYVNNEALTGLFISSHMMAVIAGIALTGPLTRVFGGKRNLYALLLAVSGALTAAFFFIPPRATALLIGANVVISFIQGPIAPLVWAMYADTADYGEWKHHRRNTGLVFAAATMAQKGGGALAGVVSGLLLASIGYVANAVQTPGALLGIRVMMTFIPGGLCLLAAVATLLYRLDDRRMKRIEQELLERRARAAEEQLRQNMG